MVKSLQLKVKEQDKKINQLFIANKEFKNSVLALYTELEKRKEFNNSQVAQREPKNMQMEYGDLMKIFQ